MPELTGDPSSYNPAQFGDILTGTCLCGSIEVTIHDEDLFTTRRGHLCHCANCRKVSGSYAASNLIIEEAKVTVTDRDGTLSKYIDKATGSGTPIERYFCSKCGKYV